MKLLFCEACRDFVRAVTGSRSEPRFCICKRHAIWGLDDNHELVRVFDAQGDNGVPDKPAAFVVLVSNRLLDMTGPMGPATAPVVLAEEGEDLFRSWGSLVLRVRPGDHPRVAWSDLPAGSAARWGTVRAAQ